MEQIILGVTHKNKALLRRMAERIEDNITAGTSRSIRNFNEALDAQNRRVKPLQDYLSQTMFGKSYAELEVPECRKINARINWSLIHDYSRTISFRDAILT